jgi:hypothetical protein
VLLEKVGIEIRKMMRTIITANRSKPPAMGKPIITVI